MNLQFPLASFAKYLDDYFQLFAVGMGDRGWHASGPQVPPSYSSDIASIVRCRAPKAVLLWPRYVWNNSRRNQPYEESLWNWEPLLDLPKIKRFTILHDAGTLHDEQAAWHRDFQPHGYVTWYHEKSIRALWPDIPAGKLHRVYHMIDPVTCPKVLPRGGRGILSGAICPDGSVYPLRHRIAQACRDGALDRVVDILPHPGYTLTGPQSGPYMRHLSGYRVAICGASAHKFALRKIFEATAVGCIVVTDLPGYDTLPGIDGNLVRVKSDATADEIGSLVMELAGKWDLDEQIYFASAARHWYDYRLQTRILSEKLEVANAH